MADELFNVVFRGDIAPGSTLEEVRQRLQNYFNLDEARAGQLFSGRPMVVKKNLDRSRADQFRHLLADMGALAQVRPMDDGAAARQSAAPATSDPSHPSDRTTTASATASPAVAVPETPAGLAGVTIEPPGADVLKPEERSHDIHREIAVDHLSVDSPGTDVLRPHERKQEVELDLDLSHLKVEPIEDH